MRSGSGRETPAFSHWRAYRRSGDLRERDHVVLLLLPVVREVVEERVGGPARRRKSDALVDAGLEALVSAVSAYAPASGRTLEQFAWDRVRAAVLEQDLLAGDRWTIPPARRRA